MACMKIRGGVGVALALEAVAGVAARGGVVEVLLAVLDAPKGVLRVRHPPVGLGSHVGTTDGAVGVEPAGQGVERPVRLCILLVG
jgi:hypothetical protein